MVRDEHSDSKETGPRLVPPHLEQHYRIDQLATLWSLSKESVRQLVKDDPGVVKMKKGPKRANTTYSVPESVARRIHNRLLSGA